MTHYPPPAPPPQPVKRRRKWPWIVAGIVVLLVVIGSCGARNQPTAALPAGAPSTAGAPVSGVTVPTLDQAAPPATADPAGSTVVYEVTGKGSALVTYAKEGFSQEQVTGAKLPWRKELAFTDEVTQFTPLSVVAQHSSGGGDITCRVLVDGKVVGESTSSGQYAVVTCTGAG